MTNKEAIEQLTNIKFVLEPIYPKKYTEALEMAMAALKDDAVYLEGWEAAIREIIRRHEKHIGCDDRCKGTFLSCIDCLGQQMLSEVEEQKNE